MTTTTWERRKQTTEEETQVQATLMTKEQIRSIQTTAFGARPTPALTSFGRLSAAAGGAW